MNRKTGSQPPRVDFLLRRLILLAGDVRDLLATGDWESALPAQDEFDAAFASLQLAVERRQVVFGPEHYNDLARLTHVHQENEHLARELQSLAGSRRSEASNVKKLNRVYSPLGKNHQPSARYIDGSA